MVAIKAFGIIIIIKLSIISIDVIDAVSASNASLTAFLKVTWLFIMPRSDNEYPNMNAKTMDKNTVQKFDKPNTDPQIMPKISPIAQPVKQCSVACKADLVKLSTSIFYQIKRAGARPPGSDWFIFI